MSPDRRRFLFPSLAVAVAALGCSPDEFLSWGEVDPTNKFKDELFAKFRAVEPMSVELKQVVMPTGGLLGRLNKLDRLEVGTAGAQQYQTRPFSPWTSYLEVVTPLPFEKGPAKGRVRMAYPVDYSKSPMVDEFERGYPLGTAPSEGTVANPKAGSKEKWGVYLSQTYAQAVRFREEGVVLYITDEPNNALHGLDKINVIRPVAVVHLKPKVQG